MQPDPAAVKAEFTFEMQARSAWADFWQRLGGVPDLAGKRVLDFGCNRGGGVHRALQLGATSAVGVDINPITTDFARERLQAEWDDKADIRCGDIRDMELEPFDLVFSTNTMEHVEDPQSVLSALVGLCKPGADLYFGFSPLWFSPFGHHHYPATRVPWLHVLKGDKVVLDAMAEQTGHRYGSVREAGFNCATPRDFRMALAAQDVEVVSSKRNVGRTSLRSMASQALLALGVVPALEKYVTVGMFWHLRKPPAKKDEFQ